MNTWCFPLILGYSPSSFQKHLCIFANSDVRFYWEQLERKTAGEKRIGSLGNDWEGRQSRELVSMGSSWECFAEREESTLLGGSGQKGSGIRFSWESLS